MIKTETMTTAQGPGSDIPSCVWHWELPGLQGSRNEDTVRLPGISCRFP